jgi:N-acetylglucosaminyldiphosphoundecaprenol N-acetyl-beta-D-mannosaminyltransferase
MHVTPRPFYLAGIRIDALEADNIVRILKQAIATNDKILFLNHNCHSMYLYNRVAPFRHLYRSASYVYIDGVPIVWLARLAGIPIHSRQRFTLLDGFDRILQEASGMGWRVFYLGGTREVNRAGIEALNASFRNLSIRGHHGYFEKHGQESEAVIAHINSFAPDVLFVGMGMPIQEMWLGENFAKLNARAVFTCGATLEYVTGHSYRPPAWTGPLGLYGVLRFLASPRRLWRRYLVEPLVLLAMIAPQILRQRLSPSQFKNEADESAMS